MPMLAAKKTANRIASVPRKIGQPASFATAQAAPVPTTSPMSPPRTQSVTLGQELIADVPASGADGEPEADLAGALGDRDQHDVHDADAADDERQRRYA